MGDQEMPQQVLPRLWLGCLQGLLDDKSLRKMRAGGELGGRERQRGKQGDREPETDTADAEEPGSG